MTSVPPTCFRCDLPMDDDGEWFICQCCRSRTRGIERQQARFEAHMAELGMTEEEYDTHCKSLTGKPTAADMKQAQALAERMVDEWVPACEHDTENPWAPALPVSGLPGQDTGGAA